MKISVILLISLFPILATAQQRSSSADDRSSDELFPAAKVEESVLANLDMARNVRQMDATPDGAHWFVVDEFAGWQQMTIDGKRFDQSFNEIASSATRMSPNGDYIIWSGLTRGYTEHGFDSTVVTLYKTDSLVGSYVADYPSLEFSPSGKRWAALMPYAYQGQQGNRDAVVVDGRVASSGQNFPHQFSFSHDEKTWAYRSTDGLDEKLVTNEVPRSAESGASSAENGSPDVHTALLYHRSESAANGSWDPTIWRYTPDVSIFGEMLEGRDYDLHFEHVARQYRTAYSRHSADTARTYIDYGGKRQGLYRWIANVVIDTAGNHIAYFACDPRITHFDTAEHESTGVVVYDGKVVAGPYIGIARLFLSPSGKHYAYSLSKLAKQFYIDKTLSANTSQIMNCVWSPNESRLAYIAQGAHDRLFVVLNGKRSPLYEQIGRLGWKKGGERVEFAAIKNGKLYHVVM